MKRVFLAILLFLGLVYFTPRLLIRLSLFLGNFSQSVVEEKKEESFLFPPVLEPLPEATNSSTLKIKGFAQGGERIELFINNLSKGKTLVGGDGEFFFERVRLYEGENKIQAVALSDSQRSEFSKEVIVFYKKRGPSLLVETPEEGANFSGEEKKIEIRGKTEPNASLRINERWVLVKNDGSFRFLVELSEGENLFKIVAQDAAGNKTLVERRVTYSQD